MELTNGERWVVFQAIEDKLFKYNMHIRDLEKLEQTKDMIYHIGNLKKDYDVLKAVRHRMQIEIELNTK